VVWFIFLRDIVHRHSGFSDTDALVLSFFIVWNSFAD
jgi:hypothetical protein